MEESIEGRKKEGSIDEWKEVKKEGKRRVEGSKT